MGQIHGIRPTGPRFSELVQVYHVQNEILKEILSHEGPISQTAESSSKIILGSCRWHGIVNRNEELLGHVCGDFVGTNKEYWKHLPRTCFSPKVTQTPSQTHEVVTIQPELCTIGFDCFKQYLSLPRYYSDLTYIRPTRAPCQKTLIFNAGHSADANRIPPQSRLPCHQHHPLSPAHPTTIAILSTPCLPAPKLPRRCRPPQTHRPTRPVTPRRWPSSASAAADSAAADSAAAAAAAAAAARTERIATRRGRADAGGRTERPSSGIWPSRPAHCRAGWRRAPAPRTGPVSGRRAPDMKSAALRARSARRPESAGKRGGPRRAGVRNAHRAQRPADGPGRRLELEPRSVRVTRAGAASRDDPDAYGSGF